MAEPFDQFTEEAKRVLQLAEDEARRLNHNYIGTEHLLLGLISLSEGVSGLVLANLGLELNRVRPAVEFIVGKGDRKITGDIGLTPRATKVMELAIDESRKWGHQYVSSEHILLGLMCEGEGIAVSALESLGISLYKVRSQIIRELRSKKPDQPPSEVTKLIANYRRWAAEGERILSTLSNLIGQVASLTEVPPGVSLTTWYEKNWGLTPTVAKRLAEVPLWPDDVRGMTREQLLQSGQRQGLGPKRVDEVLAKRKPTQFA